MGIATVNFRRKLLVCAAAVALTASGSYAAAADRPGVTHDAGARSAAARPHGGPNFTGIYLSTWGTSHVTFSRAFKSWLAKTGATVTAQAPVKLDADRAGFTMPASRATGDRLDIRGRMVYSGALVISVPRMIAGHAKQRTMKPRAMRFGPLYIRVMPDVSWSAGLSVDGRPAVHEIELATSDYAEVLAHGGTPSPSGFRAAGVPFHLSQDTADLLARTSGHGAPAAGSLFGTLTPHFDHVPTAG